MYRFAMWAILRDVKSAVIRRHIELVARVPGQEIPGPEKSNWKSVPFWSSQKTVRATWIINVLERKIDHERVKRTFFWQKKTYIVLKTYNSIQWTTVYFLLNMSKVLSFNMRHVTCLIFYTPKFITIISGKYQLYAWIAGVTGLIGITGFSLWVIHCFMSNHKCQKECASPIATLISWR